MPPAAPDVQIVETRRAFYAGVYCNLMNLMYNVGGDETSEDEGVIQLEKLKAECEAFAAAQRPTEPSEAPQTPEGDTARKAHVHERLMVMARRFPDQSIEREDVLKAAQQLKRIHDAGHEFSATAVVSQATGAGLADIVWGGYLAQLEPVKAREIAWILLEVAAVAESEAGLMRFLRDRVGVSPEKASIMLNDFRHYRDEASSLVGLKADG
jgi:hypothetical protein